MGDFSNDFLGEVCFGNIDYQCTCPALSSPVPGHGSWLGNMLCFMTLDGLLGLLPQRVPQNSLKEN